MFEITETTEATLATLTPRSEKHGDDEKPAVSLGLRMTVPNTLLDLIDPLIRQALWKAKDDQPDLPDVEPSTPVLRCNSIELVKLPRKFTGWTLHVEDGIDEDNPIQFLNMHVAQSIWIRLTGPQPGEEQTGADNDGGAPDATDLFVGEGAEA